MTPQVLAEAWACPIAVAMKWADPLSAACAFYGIDTPTRLAAFLAQTGHESGGGRYVAELWGPTAQQRRYERDFDAPWPTSKAEAKLPAFERNRLAYSLGNVERGDGELFKGHSPIQTTGRHNHARVRDRLRERFPAVPDFEADPEALTDPQWGALATADYWDDNRLNALADAGRFVAIGRAINRGNAEAKLPANGEADRLARWERTKRALSHTAAPPARAQETRSELSQEPTMPLPLILSALLPTIIEAIPKLGKLFGSGSEVAERNVKAAELAVSIVQEAVGARNAQEAAEMIAADPASAQVAIKAVEERWFELTEAGGGGIDGARKADVAFMAAGGNPLKSPAFIISLILIVMPLMLLADLFYVNPKSYDTALRTQIVTAVLLVISLIGAFWLGSSFGSQKKDDAMRAGRP